jgi:hypothetical protein
LEAEAAVAIEKGFEIEPEMEKCFADLLFKKS